MTSTQNIPASFSRLVIGAESADPFGGHLGIAVALATRMSALFSHVSDVVLLGSEKVMGRVAAKRVVAFVADIRARWNGPVFQRVSHAMRPLRDFVAYRKLPVALVANMTIPKPAIIRPLDNDLSPKELRVMLADWFSFLRLRGPSFHS